MMWRGLTNLRRQFLNMACSLLRNRMGFPLDLIDLILFGAIAVFLVLRLRSVLGRRDGHEWPRDGQPPVSAPPKQRSDDAKVVVLPDAKTAKTPAAPSASQDQPAGITQIQLADSSFTPEGFLEGASAAFEMTLTAFADGDRETLKALLSEQVYGDFEQAISADEAAGHNRKTTLVALVEAKIEEAVMDGKIASVTVSFLSDQINVVYDSQDCVVDGNPNDIERVRDLWTFTRDTRSRDPNWALSATDSEAE